MELTPQACVDFSETLWEQYRLHGRPDLPWRHAEANGRFDPYKIMCSELMLQQTQVNRVIPKYQVFLTLFPDVETLAQASLGDVLRAWQGLGYNRRAKFLWLAAQAIIARGGFPHDTSELIRLPGIGPNTAAAILAYSFNEPVVFVETNIRTVYIHHFLADRVDVSDKEILALVTQTLDDEHPREFYWALMDYGSHLKATIGNPNKASKHYVKQSVFHGSKRQIRGQVIRMLNDRSHSLAELSSAVTDERLDGVLAELVQEGLIQKKRRIYSLE